ncbi:MAG: hypothetical protein JWN24_3263 [Phycisphaerales bacterium]|nr:hypothetical protein [Phycisphaerales bacterium]
MNDWLVAADIVGMTPAAPLLALNSQGTAAPAPLSPAQLAQIESAGRIHRLVQRAARTACFSAWTMLIIGLSGGLFALISPSMAGIVTALALCVVGVVEYCGYRGLRRADPDAALLLARNQLFFLALIVAYAIWQMVSFSSASVKAAVIPDDVRSQLSLMPDLTRQIDGQIDLWSAVANYGFYALLIVLSILFQGGLALYYFTRRKHLAAFKIATPQWAQKVFEIANR